MLLLSQHVVGVYIFLARHISWVGNAAVWKSYGMNVGLCVVKYMTMWVLTVD